MFSTFISASLQLFARVRVSYRNGEKKQRKQNHQQIHIKVLDSSHLTTAALELHHHGKSHSSFVIPEVRAET